MYEAKFAGVSSPLTASSPLDLHFNSSQSPLCNDIESSETMPSLRRREPLRRASSITEGMLPYLKGGASSHEGALSSPLSYKPIAFLGLDLPLVRTTSDKDS